MLMPIGCVLFPKHIASTWHMFLTPILQYTLHLSSLCPTKSLLFIKRCCHACLCVIFWLMILVLVKLL